MGWDKDIKHFQKLNQALEQAGPSKIIDIGEKYELVTGIDENKAANLDARLLPNLHQKWLPSELSMGGLYNAQLYKDAIEQEFYESFIQPLFKIYKHGQFSGHFAGEEKIMTHNWEKKVSIDVLGPERVLFEKDDGDKRALTVGEIETTLILTVHLIDDLYRYGTNKIARRFGASVKWVKGFRKKIQKAYGRMASISVEDHIERQLGRCEGILDTFLTKARDGDHYAAKVVKDYIELEDKYIIPTVDQLSAKDTQEDRDEAMERLSKIMVENLKREEEIKKIEDKSEKN